MVPGKPPVCGVFDGGAWAVIPGASGANVSCVGCIDRLGFSEAGIWSSGCSEPAVLIAGALGTYGVSTFDGLVSGWAAYSCIPESHEPGVSV